MMRCYRVTCVKSRLKRMSAVFVRSQSREIMADTLKFCKPPPNLFPDPRRSSMRGRSELRRDGRSHQDGNQCRRTATGDVCAPGVSPRETPGAVPASLSKKIVVFQWVVWLPELDSNQRPFD